MLNFGNKEFRNLQEQVLKNAQDIEVLKGRENLQIVIVEELPEVGNPNYIYLVPNNDEEESNVYDEYIWLAEAEEYEKIGGVSIDLTNYVTTNTEQTITAVKNLSADVIPSTDGSSTLGATNKRFAALHIQTIRNDYGSLGIYPNGNINISFSGTEKSLVSGRNQTDSLGSSTQKWKNLYLSGVCYTPKIDCSENIHIGNSSYTVYIDGDSLCPGNSGQKDLGASATFWKDLYLTGNISDGVNTVSVANIASKVTSTSQTGTFDSNGESTILDGASMSEGLYIFTYGNCQCFVRLTATMIQSSDVTPIRVACPMIVSGSPSLGWLHIAKSGSNLTISVKDSNDHVDSGFAWKLIKTNLL